MVLYKRKQVSFVKPPPIPPDPNTPVYVIPATREWFLTYEEYLARMDYYKTPKFVCEITGNSCLTYFEALQSEEKEIVDVERNCPEALREHILRFLQFNRITRLDLLVDKVYSVFKNDYFPGETIYVRNLVDRPVTPTPVISPTPEDGDTHVKQRATIREKVQYAQSDSVTTKYLVVRLSDSQQLIVTPEKISRDRNHFNKWLIKTFIKLTMTRSTKVGAPWVVKEKYAKKYRISQEYPEDLRHYASSTPNGEIKFIDPKRKQEEEDEEPRKRFKEEVEYPPILEKMTFPQHHVPEPIRRQYAANVESLQPTKTKLEEDFEITFDIQRRRPQPRREERRIENKDNQNSNGISGIDGTDASNGNGTSNAIDNTINGHVSDHDDFIGVALQSWVFLNVYHKVLKLDTFTFDDFLVAMGWSWDQYTEHGRCELLDEIWCALLGAIVSNEMPSKTEANAYKENDEVYGLLVEVPERNEEKEDQKEEEEKEEEEKEEEAEEVHNAFSAMNHRGTPWHERVRKRNFKDGNWQCCVLGVLSLVKHVPKYSDLVERVFRVLAPKDLAATPSTVLQQFYEEMNVDLRFQTMAVLVDLVSCGDVVREYIDECLEQSANLRRQRLDSMKDYKQQLEAAQKIHSRLQDIVYGEDTGRRSRLVLKSVEMTPEEAQLAEQKPEFRAVFDERNAIVLKLEQLRKERRHIERRLVELDTQRVKLLGKDRMLNRYWWFENNGLPTLFDNVSDDEDHPHDDDPDLEDETYLMGRLWVQGPSIADQKVYLGGEKRPIHGKAHEFSRHPLPIKEMVSSNPNFSPQVLSFEGLPPSFVKAAQEHGLHFGYGISAGSTMVVNEYGSLTVPVSHLQPMQRKLIEECPDPLVSTNDWRYYDNPADVAELVDWLNPWGKRESSLIKELNRVKDAMTASMEARKKALNTCVDDGKQEKVARLRQKMEGMEKTTKRLRSPVRDFESVMENGTYEECEELLEMLEGGPKDPGVVRVMEWVNSTAEEEFDRGLYEGGDRKRR